MTWARSLAARVVSRSARTMVMRAGSHNAPITVLLLQEFRLRTADDADAAARIIAASPGGREPAIPLLTSIEDGRDVATLRALHAGETTEIDEGERAGLDHLVTSWAAPKEY